MTDRERAFAALGFEYAEGIEQSEVIVLASGREVRRTERGWSVQPWNDSTWLEFDDPLDAIRAGTRPAAHTLAPERATGG